MAKKCPNCGAKLDDWVAFWDCKECGYFKYKRGYEDKPEKKDDYVPVGCAACGGPYPNCKDSCPIFDN